MSLLSLPGFAGKANIQISHKESNRSVPLRIIKQHMKGNLNYAKVTWISNINNKLQVIPF